MQSQAFMILVEQVKIPFRSESSLFVCQCRLTEMVLELMPELQYTKNAWKGGDN